MSFFIGQKYFNFLQDDALIFSQLYQANLFEVT